MAKKELTFTSKLILAIHQAEDMAMPWILPREWRKRVFLGGDYDSYRAIMYRLEKRGLLKFIKYKDSRFVQLTAKGQLEALFIKAKLPFREKWDGKWRLIVFDIPEEARLRRDQFRKLLKINQFKKLQQSVFISPYPLSREAIEYLEQSKLIENIRIMRVDEMDNDAELRQSFGL